MNYKAFKIFYDIFTKEEIDYLYRCLCHYRLFGHFNDEKIEQQLVDKFYELKFEKEE